jgi:integrase
MFSAIPAKPYLAHFSGIQRGTVPKLCQTGDGTVATYTRRGKSVRVQVRKPGHKPQSRTFPTLTLAKVWAERIERGLAEREARGVTEAHDMTLREAVDWYVREVGPSAMWGRSKEADLQRIAGYPMATTRIVDLDVRDYVSHASRRRLDGAGPATIVNDLVWIRQVLKSVRATLGVPVDLSRLDDASHELRQRKVIGKPKSRTRRIAPDELGALLAHFERKGSYMVAVIRFALLTARRLEEITRLRWADVGETTAWLDDVKHPTQKIGNRREFRLVAEARKLIEDQPRTSDRVFPYNPKTISKYFADACKLTGIKDLRFHDLRHEATSRLFERGYSIQEVCQFTLHESWGTLKRYTHLSPKDVPER